MYIVFFFFFKQKTAYEMRISDWSSDVCSSDLDARPIDADNHYYETLDAFTRHLDPKMADRGVKPVQDGKRVKLLIGGEVHGFIPNPTFNPIIVPGCLDPRFRGQIPEGVDPRPPMQVSPPREEDQDRDKRTE